MPPADRGELDLGAAPVGVADLRRLTVDRHALDRALRIAEREHRLETGRPRIAAACSYVGARTRCRETRTMSGPRDTTTDTSVPARHLGPSAALARRSRPSGKSSLNTCSPSLSVSCISAICVRRVGHRHADDVRHDSRRGALRDHQLHDGVGLDHRPGGERGVAWAPTS